LSHNDAMLQIEELLPKLRDLDEQTFLTFARIMGPYLWRLFVRRGMSALEAEELAQSCITDLVLKVDRYDPARNGPFAAWLKRSAYNAQVDWWRKQKLTVPLDENLIWRDDQEEETDNQALIIIVREAIGQLGVDDQETIMLRYVGAERSYAEIGEQLGITATAARVRHHRALARLEKILLNYPLIQERIIPLNQPKPAEG
jgi:RNA polymerase sigma factor (sigma-70 family)